MLPSFPIFLLNLGNIPLKTPYLVKYTQSMYRENVFLLLSLRLPAFNAIFKMYSRTCVENRSISQIGKDKFSLDTQTVMM